MSITLLGAGNGGSGGELASSLAPDAIFNLYNDPKVIYDPSTNAYLLGTLDKTGIPWLHRYEIDTGYLQSAQLQTSVLEKDDHASPTITVLNAAGANANKCFCAYSTHTGNAFQRLSYLPNSISGLVPAGTVVIKMAYTVVYQMSDDDYTIYRFFRDEETIDPPARPRCFKTSTDGGVTFSSTTVYLQIGDERPYPFICKDGNKVHFLTSRGHAQETRNSVYHFYMQVGADGSRTWHQSDGTLIGDDTALPVGLDDMTLAYDGSLTNAFVYDLCVIDGVLTGIIATYDDQPTTCNCTHNYRRLQYLNGSWVMEFISDAGGTGGDWLYSPEFALTPGSCLDPHNDDVVCSSRKYGANNFRTEEWQRVSANNWVKVRDLSGNTNSTNARPTAAKFCPTTQFFWYSGRYTTYNDWDTAIATYPPLAVNSLPSPIAKPTNPVWQASVAATLARGCNHYYPLHEGSGTVIHDLVPSGAKNGSFQGSPTWGSNAYGPYLFNFSTLNYVFFEPITQAIATGVYPFWMAVMFSNTSQTFQVIASAGRSTSSIPFVAPTLNFNSNPGNTHFNMRDNAGTGSPNLTKVIPAIYDGNNHVWMLISWTANHHQSWFDGVLQMEATTALGALTTDRLTLGGFRRDAGNTSPLLGNAFSLATGESDAPDAMSFARDWLSGAFSVVRG